MLQRDLTRITRRDYAAHDDLPELIRFGQRIWTPASRWHLGDLSWDLASTPTLGPQTRMAIWELDGRMVAYSWLIVPGNLSLLVDPTLAGSGSTPGRPGGLVDVVVDWANEAAGAPVAVTVLDTETDLIEPLKLRGLTEDRSGHFFQAMSRDLVDLPPIPELTAGFTIRAVRGERDAPSRAGLHREVWSSSLSDDDYRAMTGLWSYRAEFDRVVEAPDGTLVSYILGWYDDLHGCGEFEPVGTLESYRRRGLSRALGIALMHAFRDAGGERAIVYARGDDDYPVPRQVYTNLGFRTHGRTLEFRP